MLIEEKFFHQDKNHLLKAVQAFSKDMLIDDWVKVVFKSYNQLHNPMGLEDDFILLLRDKIGKCRDLLEGNYDILAAIYRFKHGDNQLEFQWDGRSHMDRYDEDWKAKYAEWVEALCAIKEIQRPLIRYATQGEGFNNDFLRSSIRRAILSHYDLKLKSQRLQRLSA